VQPGPGNPLPPRETYTLKDMDERSLQVLRTRATSPACWSTRCRRCTPTPTRRATRRWWDSSRRAGFDRAAYTAWLQRLREVCTERGIVLIFDEVFVGFRLAPGGAQQYFGVQADMVTYGKTLGGGLPVGVVCGRRELMKRFRDDRPADICFARGTFNAHPYVMAAMNAFLSGCDRPEVQALYDGLDERWNARAARFNQALAEAGLPVRVANLSTIWTVLYTEPSRYHWMLQFYLRAQGLALSWVGTGRLIFSLNYGDADFDAVLQRFVAAARADAAPTAGGGSDAGADRPQHPAQPAARDAGSRTCGERAARPSAVPHVRHRVEQLAAQQASGDFQYSAMSWKGSVRILSARPGRWNRSCCSHSCSTRKASPLTPSASQAMPTSCSVPARWWPARSGRTATAAATAAPGSAPRPTSAPSCAACCSRP
jgi:hypothetical protein